MAEITSVAVITVKPEAADQVEHLLMDLVDDTHAEPGCLHYSLHRGAQPGVFVTMEKWDDRASLDAHLASSHVLDAIEKVTPLLATDLQIIPATAVRAGDPAKGSF